MSRFYILYLLRCALEALTVPALIGYYHLIENGGWKKPGWVVAVEAMSLLALAIAIAAGGHLGRVFVFALALEFAILYFAVLAALALMAWALSGVGEDDFDPMWHEPVRLPR